MKNATILLAAAVLLASSATAGQVGGGGIVYGSELGASVTAPDGWVFDNESGVDQGLHAVMYPVGSTWANSKAVIYVNFSQLEPQQTLEGFIAVDIAEYRKRAPKLSVESVDPIMLVGGAKAVVRQFKGDDWGNHEAVAYASLDSGIAMYVLTCRDEDSFRKSLSAFKDVVAGSALMHVVIQH